MRIIFSKHALLKMNERRITKTKVIKTINEPTSKHDCYSLRVELYKRFGKRYLKVVIKNTPYSVIVITTHWVEKSSKK